MAALRITVSAALVAASLALVACATPRPCEPVRVPVIVNTEKLVVEPIPPKLLREHPEATGDLRHCPDVSKHNLAELRACNADKAMLREHQRGRQE